MDYAKARFNMVEQQIRPWDVLDFDLLDVLQEIPREEFVLPEQRGYAYADMPLKLANGSMMLEPKIIARMIQGLKPMPHESVLEIGTGSGYATAILAKLANDVHTHDIDEIQITFAKNVLNSLNYTNIHFEQGDGLASSDNKTYDAIYIGGSLPHFPEQLISRLNPQGGRMVVVVGTEPIQRCLLITRNGETFGQKTLFDTQITALHDPVFGQPNRFTF